MGTGLVILGVTVRVRAGLGLSVVPTTSKPQMVEMGLECRTIASPVIVHEIGMVTLRRQPLSVAATTMQTYVKSSS